MWWLVSLALAGGMHSGIPVSALSDPSFADPELGWSGNLPGGWARVFVGPTEAAAVAWYDNALATLTLPAPPAEGVGDACAGDDALFAFRDGNVAVLVRAETGARAHAEALHARIVDGVPLPAAPGLREEAGRWIVDAPWAVHVSGRGPVVPFQRGVWTARPDGVVAWDAYGRPVPAR